MMKALKRQRSPLIVFGTTPDYVEKIYHHDSRETFFVMDVQYRCCPSLKSIDSKILFFARLENMEETIQSLVRHFAKSHISPCAIACFDCESLIATSMAALRLGLTFPLPGPVVRARNKFDSRRSWRKAGLLSPSAVLASNVRQTLAFFNEVNKDIVIKPLSASGSELLFHCSNEDEILGALETMMVQLSARRSHPLFRPITNQGPSERINPCTSWIAEEYISGPEFSCDFVFLEGKIRIIRETGKVKDPAQFFGTVTAYAMPPRYPPGFSSLSLVPILRKAVCSLGFRWGYFMADFIVHGSGIFILEISPRPGGDAIPELVQSATGIGLLSLYLDFMSGRWPVTFPSLHPSQPMAAVNLYAPKEGIISELDADPIHALP
jgi:biotin carboxylase